MKLIRKLLLILAIIITVSLVVIPAYAQAPSVITAEVDRTSLTTDETVTLTVYIDESLGQPGQPLIPPLDGFQVVGSSKGTQMSIINGDWSIKSTYSYRLSPIQPGVFVIDPVIVSISGQAYATQPITVEVAQGNGQSSTPQSGSPFGSLFSSILGLSNLNIPPVPSRPSQPNVVAPPSGAAARMDPAEAPVELAGQSYYLESRIDNPNPYQGEQIAHTLRLYQPANAFSQPEYQPPVFTGFWSQSKGDQSSQSLQFAGRNYQVIELDTILVPTVIDQIVVDGASIEIPGGLFSPGQRLRSNPISVDVRALPGGAPSSFSGAVGQFEIAAEVDATETVVNDTLTIKLTLSGSGNIETMGDPQWPDMPGWRAFDSQAATESYIDDGALKGQRQYERVMVPTEPGILSIPAVEFSYFNPETEEYVTILTESLSITVAADGQSNVQALTRPTVSRPSSSVQPFNDIRPLKISPDTWAIRENQLLKSSGYWILWTIPLMFLVLQFTWGYRKKRRSDNADIHRSMSAQKKAIHALKKAKKDKAVESDQVGPILIGYLENKLNLSLSGCTNTAISKLMGDRGVEDELADRIQNMLLLSEMGRFAPGSLSGPDGDVISDSIKLVKDLDKVLKPNKRLGED